MPNRFDQVAAEWDAQPARVAMARGVADAIRTAVPFKPDSHILDLGAGTGLLSLALLSDVGNVTAVDSSVEMVKMLNGKIRAGGLTNIQAVHGDIQSLPFPDRIFDMIVSSMVLHHLANVPAVLESLCRYLKSGGWIALADLDTEDGTFHADPTGVYHRGFDRERVRTWLTAAGFIRVETRDACSLARSGKDGVLRTYPLFLVTARVG